METNDAKRLLKVSKADRNLRNSFPLVYSNARIRNGRAEATDLNTTLFVETDIQGEGIISLPDLINFGHYDKAWIQDGFFYLERNGNISKKGTMGDPTDWPGIKKPVRKFGVVTANDVKTMQECTKYVSKDEMRPTMNGVFYSKENKEWVATDSRALIKREAEGELQGDVILPTLAISLLKATDYVVYDDDETDWIQIADYEAGDHVITRKIGGVFPNYRAVFPKHHSINAYLNKNELLSELKIAKSFINPQTNTGAFYFNKEELTIYVNDIDYGKEWEKTIPAYTEGKPLVIGFNIKYLEKCLRSVEGFDVEFRMESGHQITIINNNILLISEWLPDETVLYLKESSTKPVLKKEPKKEVEPVSDPEPKKEVEPVSDPEPKKEVEPVSDPEPKKEVEPVSDPEPEKPQYEIIIIENLTEKAFAVVGFLNLLPSEFTEKYGSATRNIKIVDKKFEGMLFSKKRRETLAEIINSQHLYAMSI